MEWDPSRWPEQFTIERMQAACLALVMRVLHESPSACDVGITILVDFAGASTRQLRGISSSDRQRGWGLLQGSIPVRVASIIIVNESLPMDVLLWTMRPFVSAKIWGRIHRCGGDLEQLHSMVPPSALPQQLGGDMDEADLQRTWQSFIAARTVVGPSSAASSGASGST